jgi:hypothetical protein
MPGRMSDPVFWHSACDTFHTPSERDSKLADNLVWTAVRTLRTLPGEKTLCTRRALKEALRAAVPAAVGEIGWHIPRESDR